MKEIDFIQLSSLEKVYLDYKLPEKEFCEATALKNEKISYQIAYKSKKNYDRYFMKISASAPKGIKVSVRQVGNVPAELVIRGCSDEHYERYSPGLFPDVLYPINNNELDITFGVWHSLWITAEVGVDAKPGKQNIDITFSDGKISETKTFTLNVIDAVLPKQELVFTQWFHTDCIADYYNVDVFSERHWQLTENFVKVANENGINMILTPVFTPPLDTDVGGERTTVQLVDITKDGDSYTFGFEKLRRWIDMCRRNNIKYFEIAHLFTQWGAKFTPKIMANVNGKQKRIFGWDVEALSDEYKNFLSQFLPSLIAFLREMGVAENTYFHISDEPHGDENKEQYAKLKKFVDPYLNGFKIIDAISDIDFYKSGIMQYPVPSTSKIDIFIEQNIPELWTYYCCSQSVGVSNRFLAMPSYRNRIIGLQLYKYDIKGFLHWGYNFYNSALSKRKINPFVVTDAGNIFQAGDAFSVYPGEDGAIESLRLVVFHEALQDLRALKLLEKHIGKEETVKLIEKEAGMEIKFDKYPHSSNFMLDVREKINLEIQKNIGEK